MQTLSDRMLSARKSKALTIDEMADKLGIGRNRLIGYETGVEIPSAEVLERYGRIGISVNWLLLGLWEMDLPVADVAAAVIGNLEETESGQRSRHQLVPLLHAEYDETSPTKYVLRRPRISVSCDWLASAGIDIDEDQTDRYVTVDLHQNTEDEVQLGIVDRDAAVALSAESAIYHKDDRRPHNASLDTPRDYSVLGTVVAVIMVNLTTGFTTNYGR